MSLGTGNIQVQKKLKQLLCYNKSMNYIFYFLIVISIIAGAVNGKLPDVVNAILTGAELSVKVAFSLIGIMAFWLGMMKIAEKCGLVALIAKIIKPVTRRLFNEIPEDSPAIGDIAMSCSANAFGLMTQHQSA